MTIARKLWLGFGALILVFLIAGLTILLSAAAMNREHTEIVSVAMPVRSAAYEMEIHTTEIGRDVRVYMLNADPSYREEFAKDRAEFEESKARFDELVDDQKGKELATRIDTLYGEYVSLGDSLMDKKDQQGTVSTGKQEEFLKRQNELDSLLAVAGLAHDPVVRQVRQVVAQALPKERVGVDEHNRGWAHQVLLRRQHHPSGRTGKVPKPCARVAKPCDGLSSPPCAAG